LQQRKFFQPLKGAKKKARQYQQRRLLQPLISAEKIVEAAATNSSREECSSS
jgi:hypothetical protein